MKNLLLMRAPPKYIQGSNALKHFHENIKEFGNNYFLYVQIVLISQLMI